MNTNILISNIEDFVNRIGVVHLEQVLLMFNSHGKDTVVWCIKQLAGESRINYDPNNKLLKRRQLLSEKDLQQRLLTEAAWLLAHMGESKVRDYYPLNYPFQLLIVAEDDTVYDITVFTFQTINSIMLTYKRLLAQCLPVGVEDNVVHIAVVADDEMAQEIRPLGMDNYCIINNNNVPCYKQWRR